MEGRALPGASALEQRANALGHRHERLRTGLTAAATAARPLLARHAQEGADHVAIVVLQTDLVAGLCERLGKLHGAVLGPDPRPGKTRDVYVPYTARAPLD